MGIELDHFFIWVSVEGVEAEQLVSFGLSEGASNVHPGQGTACRRFFFHNAYLELLWCHNRAEAVAEPAHDLQLWERCSRRRNGACPFGFIFRPAPGPEAAEPPFGRGRL